MSKDFHKLFTLSAGRKPVIGMIHLGSLPGSPGWSGSMDEVARRALADAAVLAEEGVDGFLIENYGDAPFFPEEVPPVTVAAMAVLVERLRRETAPKLPIGVNVLRNDARAALSVAAAAGAAFIRVNVHTGVTATDQGLLTGTAHLTLRLREQLGPSIAILADLRVKHGRSLVTLSLEDEVGDLVERGGADAVLMTGPRTGSAADLEELEAARAVLHGLRSRAGRPVPLLAASGITPSNAHRFLPLVDGCIVGTGIKRGGRTSAPVDRRRVRLLLEKIRSAGSSGGKSAGRRRTP